MPIVEGLAAQGEHLGDQEEAPMRSGALMQEETVELTANA